MGDGRFAGVLCVALFLASSALAQTPAVRVEGPWARATPNGAKVAAGYLTLVNDGKEPDRLLGGSVPFAGRVEVHEMATSGGVMKMRAIEGGLAVPAGGTVVLKPGGNHLMFQDLSAPLKEGETVAGTLLFEKAGSVPVRFRVGGIGGAAPPAHHDR